ncbi:MAG: NAD-dependent protein deacetylase [Gammaproteobacteria bacterium]
MLEPPTRTALERLARFVADHPRLFILTGAGVSTGSGIPDYRDDKGEWKRKPPVMYQEFVSDEATRKRYWARSLVGWRWFARARPNRSHAALARLESAGRVQHLVTQNVDRLHQRAGSEGVIDLHGRLDRLICLDCGHEIDREIFQRELERLNPELSLLTAGVAPDGDADLEGIDFSRMDIPSCPRCDGLLKPHVVFFGESVPRERVDRAMDQLRSADAVLVVGTSLMVFSGYRFVREASRLGKPIAAINQGRTRGDDLFSLKVPAPCGDTLESLLGVL